MKVSNKEFFTRYFTYYLYFSKDGSDYWVKQIPFIHELAFELKNMRGVTEFQKFDLAHKGETTWTDQNGVRHHIVIENIPRDKKWGTKPEKLLGKRR